MVSVALLKPERMGTIDLFNYVRHLDANGQTAQRYEIEFWKKVFYPLSCLVMVMLALPFAYLHFRSGGIAGYVFAGVMIGISFFLLNNVFGYIGNLRNWQPWLAAATPGCFTWPSRWARSAGWCSGASGYASMASATLPRGIILLAHGSRDPQWREPIEAVAAQIRIRRPGTPVLCAYLELCAPSLPEAATNLIAEGADSIRVFRFSLVLGSTPVKTCRGWSTRSAQAIRASKSSSCRLPASTAS
jgi:hypothetical protein